MNFALVDVEPPRRDWHAPVRTSAGPAPHALPGGDAAYLALQTAYRGHGGIARGEALAGCLGRAGHGGYIDLARRLVGGELFSFQWHDAFWVPLFQFDPQLLTRRDAPRQVLDELRGVMDGWEIAHWYVRENASLDGRRPLDLLDTDLPAVLATARADRFTVDS